MTIFRNFYITCHACGHRNRPAKSPRESVRLTLTGHIGPCRGCGEPLRPEVADRPLVRLMRDELRAQGIEPVC